MRVYDEAIKDWNEYCSCEKFVVEVRGETIIFGYTSKKERLVEVVIYHNGDNNIYYTDLNLFKGKLLFSKSDGRYFYPNNLSKTTIALAQLLKGCGNFPYLLTKHYEAIESFKIFENRQVILNPTKYPITNYLKYSIGLEFETSQGYIPEDICYRDGLIPLRDGSITGIEYSTVILNGNDGISLLKQQLDTLKEYTSVNKDCSLHIHLGNYPLTPKTIFNLYNTCYNIEEDLARYVPVYTFHSNLYKSNQKDYCKKLEKYDSFEKMYKHLVGRNFFGSFTQVHPKDRERARKWNVTTRYYYVNFINALCYNVNKTIEFRFLRPTYNFKKILLWLYIFNGILKYSEKYDTPCATLKEIINKCYSKKLANKLNDGLTRLYALTSNQQLNGDNIGAEIWMEDALFDDLDI